MESIGNQFLMGYRRAYFDGEVEHEAIRKFFCKFVDNRSPGAVFY